ncbi:PEP-CTERM sorting domain-containing protein [Thalassotalea sp. M1531]|uniref:PEP-CTERM sorting domain-containing protein n=1 Tax=Thalassotalea algicola TaxID=2716224 RepID=A0A7Y0Q7B0_9GAMM|nr:PEP-CTERM sorting domain-containing protein [Thalassotalea algicola]NMP32283.1 PEP-CTERM sorting domain-containing protein [Thalassotalea algicola]
MKLSFFNTVVVSVVLSVGCFLNNANAGLIHNDLNWLELSVTNGLSYNEVEQDVLTNSLYQGYRFATASEVSTLYSDFLLEQAGNNLQNNHFWHIAAQPNTNLATYFSGMFTPTSWNGDLSTIDGRIQLNNADYNWGYFLYGPKTNNTVLRGTLHTMYDKGTDTLRTFVERPQSYSLSLHATTPATINADWKYYAAQSFLVKAVEVPEPSAFFIFSLGMMGLVLRRSKKLP